MTKKNTIEQKYKSMTDREHVIFRSGMYIGSTKKELQTGFLYNINTKMMEQCEYTVVPGMLKIVDEIISNSCDEFRRPDNMGLTHVDVEINTKDGYIKIHDNGGIPVVEHKEAGCWLPEFIFGQLRTSSNYNDDEERSGVGTNGVGSSIANIFSTKFIIETCDGKKYYKRSWSDNMSVLNDDLIIRKVNKDQHGTTTTMYIDFKQFNNNKLDDEFCRIILTRCINIAAANRGLTINYIDDSYTQGNDIEFVNEQDELESILSDDTKSATIIDINKKLTFNFNTLEEYVTMMFPNMVEDKEQIVTYSDNDKSFIICPDNNINIGFVNGAECSNGTHIKAIRSFINDALSTFIKKKHKIDVTPRQCDNCYSLFCDVTVMNPSYDSQTKDTLTTPVNKFYKDENKKFIVSDDVIKKCLNSDIIECVLDWYKQKSTAEDAKTLRKLNREAAKGLKRPDKFIDCASKKVRERQLWIFEGDSAKAAFRSCRNPQTQAGLIMRGVPKCAYGMKATDIMKNEVYNDIIKVTGLKFGEDFNMKDLKFSKIVISSDMDVDGHHIAGLLQQFFSQWPELFEQGIIVRSISPIIIAKKGNKSKSYHSLEEYKKDEKNVRGWTIKFVKGLSGLSMEESKVMYLTPKFEKYDYDTNADNTFDLWFSNDVNKRKKVLI